MKKNVKDNCVIASQSSAKDFNRSAQNHHFDLTYILWNPAASIAVIDQTLTAKVRLKIQSQSESFVRKFLSN